MSILPRSCARGSKWNTFHLNSHNSMLINPCKQKTTFVTTQRNQSTTNQALTKTYYESQQNFPQICEIIMNIKSTIRHRQGAIIGAYFNTIIFYKLLVIILKCFYMNSFLPQKIEVWYPWYPYHISNLFKFFRTKRLTK